MKKSSDNSNQPKRLEAVFRDGFEPAEVKPGAHIWSRIEQELAGKQANYYKKRLAWYRSVAAASVLLLTFAMGYLWYNTQNGSQFNAPDNKTGLASRNQTNIQTTPQPASTIPAPIAAESLAGRQPVTEPSAITSGNSGSPRRNTDQLALTTRRATARANLPLNQDQSQTLSISSVATPSEVLALVLEPATQPVNQLPADSMGLPARTPEAPTASAQYPSLATTEPPSKKQAEPAARWSLGGGTGSQYFEQNVKFNPASSNSMGFAPAFSSSAGTAISNNSGGASVAAAMKEFNENTRSAFSYRAAIAGNYRLNNTWSLEAGFIFAENKAQTITSYIINKPALARSSYEYASGNFLDSNIAGKSVASNVTVPVTVFMAELSGGYLNNTNVTVDKVSPFNVSYRYRQVGVPIKIRYQQGRGNWFTFVQAGGAVNILLQTSILSDSPRVPDVEYVFGQTSPFRKWHFTALGSVGRGLKISEVWQVQGSLDVARNFSTLTAADLHPNTSQRKPFYVGFGLSSSYLIRKKTNIP